MSNDSSFKLVKLVVLLITIPLLFLVPYLFSKDKAKDATLQTPEILQDLISHDQASFDSLLLHHDRFDHKTFTFDANGKKNIAALQYIWYAPQRPWPEGLKFPLVVHLHSMKDRLYSAEYLTEGKNQINFPAFHIAPIAPKDTLWGYYKDTQKKQIANLIPKMVEETVQQFPVDTNRIYIIGCAEGAEGVFAAVKNTPTLFSGAVALSGTWSANDTNEAFNQTPILMINGEQDEKYPVSQTRQFVHAAKQNGANITYKEVDSMTHSCSDAHLYKNAMWQWLFNQKK